MSRSPCRWLMALTIAACSGSDRGPTSRPTPVATVDAAPLAPDGDDFEAAAIGALPAGWRLDEATRDTSFAAVVDGAGQVLAAVTAEGGSGTLRHALDVERYRGQRIVVTGRASIAPVNRWASGVIGLELTRATPAGYDDRGLSARIAGPGWADYRAVLDVGADATALDLVVIAAGASTLQVDDLRIAVLGPAGTGDEPPRPLDGRGLDNVVAFARLYGAIRYFHPSDEAAALDPAAWERFVVRGVRAVEPARDATALAATLTELFAPLAPSAKVWTEGATEPATPTADAATSSRRWYHQGVGLSEIGAGVYASDRADASAPSRYSTVVTSVDPEAVRGQTVRIKVRMHAELAAGADAGLWIQVQRSSGQPGFYTEPEAQPAPASGWTDVEVTATIDDDATAIWLGVQVIGDGTVLAELPSIATVKVPAWGKRALATEWQRWGLREDLYDVAVNPKGCAKKKPCISIAARPAPPVDDRPWQQTLPGGVVAQVPLVVGHDGAHTVPVASAALPAEDDAPLLATDRAVRLTAVIIGWNVPQHFYPYFDVVPANWAAELPRALGRAADDTGMRALHVTLRRMIAGLHDGHGYVTNPAEPRTYMAPWSWEHVEGELVITEVAASCDCDLAAGDVVTSLDGVATANALAAALELESTATPQHAAWNLLWTLRTGPPGTIALGIRRGDDAGRTVEIARSLVAITVPTLKEARPAQGAEVAPGIRYVDIDALTQEEWPTLLPTLASADTVIYDLRGYPGAFPLGAPLANTTDTTLDSPIWLTPTPGRPDQDGMTFAESHWTIAPATPRLRRVVFVTDGRAVSAAETWMQIVAHYKLGEIVGATTAGTNGNINPFTVPGGYQIYWTGLKVLKHDRSTFHGVGVAPTVPAERTIAGIAAGRDEVLEVAIEVARRPAKKAPKHKK